MANPFPPTRRSDRPEPGPRRRNDGPSARTVSCLLVIAGALLVWPVDPLLASEVAALGAILIAVGVGGALAEGSRARRARDRTRRPR
jgi:hypothetical protein